MAKQAKPREGPKGVMVKTTVELDRELWKRLHHTAIDFGVSFQALVSDILKQAVGGGEVKSVGKARKGRGGSTEPEIR